jgi:hypothetical protein
MSMYRARWTDPETGAKRFRDFHSKPKADAFAELPRSYPVLVQRLGDTTRRLGA